MKSEERKSITNGIWLCQSCSKLIDNDVRRYTIEILYAWKRETETQVMEEMGYETGERERRKRIGKLFAEESSAAQQIALDQPRYWEFLLIAELLRSKLNRVREKFGELERGLVYRPLAGFMSLEEFGRWLVRKLNDQIAIWKMIDVAISEDMNAALGPLGIPGDAEAILRSTNHVESACNALLEWDIDFIFSQFPIGLEDIHEQFKGWSAVFINEIQRIPNEINQMLDQISTQENPEGPFNISLKINIPPDAEKFFQNISERLTTIHNSST